MLNKFEYNNFSQFGEDGIIIHILNAIGSKNQWCVEFGAWDGKYLSNTYNLILNHNYRAVLIEGSQSRYKDLCKLSDEHKGQIIPINCFIDLDANSLDNILSETPIPMDFDVLSIDIDGNDYHIFKSMKNYKPKIVIIEYNPTIPNEVLYYQEYDPMVNRGSSIRALYELALEKGYCPVASTTTNLILIDIKYADFFHFDTSLNNIRPSAPRVTYIFFGYDGKVLLDGAQYVPWINYKIDPLDFEVLPKFLRQYPGSLNKFYKFRLKMFLKIKKIFKYINFFY